MPIIVCSYACFKYHQTFLTFIYLVDSPQICCVSTMLCSVNKIFHYDIIYNQLQNYEEECQTKSPLD